MKRIYQPVLRRALGHRWIVLAAEFVPQLDEGSPVLMSAVDTSLAQQMKAGKVLLEEFTEIAYVFSRIGPAEVQIDPMGPNLSDTFILFVPEEKWRKVNDRRITKDELADTMARTAGAKGLGLNGPSLNAII